VALVTFDKQSNGRRIDVENSNPSCNHRVQHVGKRQDKRRTAAVRHARTGNLLMSGVARDVAGTLSATINWNTVSDSSIVMPIQSRYRNTVSPNCVCR